MFTRILNTPFWGWRNPFAELENLKEQLERGQRWAGVFPLINVTEDKDHYRIRAELPGLKAEDLDISATAVSVAIAGERKIPEEGKDANYHRREREAGKFSRMVKLPGEIDPSKVEANLTDGILTVTLPKSEAAKPRQIAIS
jgi:HSP20 family protein